MIPDFILLKSFFVVLSAVIKLLISNIITYKQ